jgi:hypothetical protein
LNLKHFIQRDTWLASAAPRLTRAQHLWELWEFSDDQAVQPLEELITFDSFLTVNAAQMTRAQRLEELWVFLQVPPHSVARGPRVDRLVLVRRKAIRIQLAAVGWEN